MGDLKEVFFSLREDLETGGQEKGQGSWGEGQDPPAPVSQCYLTLAGSDLLETHRERGGAGAEQWEQHPQTPPAPPRLQGSVSTCRAPAQGPAKQENVPWTRHTGNEQELTDTHEPPVTKGKAQESQGSDSTTLCLPPLLCRDEVPHPAPSGQTHSGPSATETHPSE